MPKPTLSPKVSQGGQLVHFIHPLNIRKISSNLVQRPWGPGPASEVQLHAQAGARKQKPGHHKKGHGKSTSKAVGLSSVAPRRQSPDAAASQGLSRALGASSPMSGGAGSQSPPTGSIPRPHQQLTKLSSKHLRHGPARRSSDMNKDLSLFNDFHDDPYKQVASISQYTTAQPTNPGPHQLQEQHQEHQE